MSRRDQSILNDCTEWLNRRKGERDLLERQLTEKKQSLAKEQTDVDVLIKARWVLTEVIRITQENVKEYIESLVTMAIRSVLIDRPYKFLVEFRTEGNRSNCHLLVQEADYEPYVPKDDQGGGIIDVCSFALRVVVWSLGRPRTMPVLYLDEPMRQVGETNSEEIARTRDMISQVTKECGLQLILNTHDTELASMADRVFRCVHDGVKSIVTETSKKNCKLLVDKAMPSGDSSAVERGPSRSKIGGSNPSPRSRKRLGQKKRKRLG